MYDSAVAAHSHASSTHSALSARRRFLGHLGFGSAALGAFFGSVLPARAQTAPAAPRRHETDDWMDQLPTAHRMIFDAVTAQGLGDVRRYANNVFFANRTGYGLESRDIGIILILRHHATPCAFNDAMWAKYGSAFAPELKLVDEKTQKAPTVNPANASGETLDSLSGQGAHFGVCAMATRRYAGMAARATGGTVDAVFDELARTS